MQNFIQVYHEKGYALVHLTQGKSCIIDIEDIDLIREYKWYAANIRGCYYARTKKDGKTLPMHRLILGTPKGLITDHKDGNGLNNKRENLRICNHFENGRNRKLQGGTSIYKGVYWGKDGGAWKANIRVDRKLIYLGRFKNEVDAALAYNKAAIEYHKEFARLNII